jgi:hypothetical protein
MMAFAARSLIRAVTLPFFGLLMLPLMALVFLPLALFVPFLGAAESRAGSGTHG